MNGICRGCGGPGLVDTSGFCSPGCAYGGPSYVLSDSEFCRSCGGFVEPTGYCPDCDETSEREQCAACGWFDGAHGDDCVLRQPDELRRVHVCTACIARQGSECHTPGCLFFLRDVQDVPPLLADLTAYAPELPDDPRVEVLAREAARSWFTGEQSGWTGRDYRTWATATLGLLDVHYTATHEMWCGGDPEEGDCAWGPRPWFHRPYTVPVVDPKLPPCFDCGHGFANHHEHVHEDGDRWIECAPGCRCEDWRPRDIHAHGIAVEAIDAKVGSAGDPYLSQWIAAAVDALLVSGWTPPEGEQTVYETDEERENPPRLQDIATEVDLADF